MSLKLSADELLVLAKSAEHAVFTCLMNAQVASSEKEQKSWFAQADKLESKFKTEFGKHYSELTRPEVRVFFT